MSEIKAIQTEYKGYLFRSRLEARWAVFFDACPGGFSARRLYLPLDSLRSTRPQGPPSLPPTSP